MSRKAQFATRESILAFVDFQTRDVVVPEWGGMTVRVRTMTARERDDLEAPMVESAAAGKDATFANFRARLVALVCVNEDGSRMFTLDDVEALGNKSGAAIGRIADAAIALNGITPEEADELGKESAATNGSGSGSSSPARSA